MTDIIRAFRLLPLLVIISGCGGQDWRAAAIADAQRQIRTDVGDPAASFSGIAVTGDSATGQSCGFVTARMGAAMIERTGRFIVYIDGTAGPFTEDGMGAHALPSVGFENAWRGDCLNEGYAGKGAVGR